MTVLDDRPRRVLLQYGITVAIIALSVYVLSRIVSPSEVVTTFTSLEILPYAVAIGFFYITFPIRALRWQILLDGVDVDADVRSATLIILLNWFLNTLLPTKAGDIHRSFLAHENYGASRATALGTIAAERVIDLGVLALTLSMMMVIVIPQFTSFELRIILLAFGLLAILGGILVGMFVFNPTILPNILRTIVRNFRAGFTAIDSFRELVIVLSITIVMWALNVVRMSFVASAVDFDIALPMLVLIALLIAFLSGLPYTPAGVGVVEVVTTSVLVAGTGVAEGTGLTFILSDRLITVGSLIVIGAVVYVYLRLTSDLQLLGDTDEDADPTTDPKA